MSKDRMFSIITIACFVSILFIPIGLVTMWFSTSWKKKLKFILSAAFTLLYIGIIALILLLEPAYNTSGTSLPINVSAGQTAFETSGGGKAKEADEVEGESKRKTDKSEDLDEVEERLPKSVKKQSGSLGRPFFTVMFFLFMLFLIIWQNMKAKKKKGGYENPYVDTTQYKLPLSDNAKMPMVHFLKLKMNAGEKIYYATETTQKDNQGDFVVTNQRVVVFGKSGDYEFPMNALSAVSSVSNSVMLLTCGDRKYYIFMPENQMKYALAVVRWAYSKVTN
ncbi:MAG: hypothetical protein K6C97_08895 [Treponema sp.]|nr:hypothetical protein [Treponema sp.]